MRGETQAEDEAEYPIDADLFRVWAEKRGADVVEEDCEITAEWGEKTHITMRDGYIEAWKPYNAPPWNPPALDITKVEPEEEPLSMTSAGKGELDSTHIAGNRLVIESTHVGEQHKYVVEVDGE